MMLRARDGSCPKTVDVRWPRNVKSAWPATTASSTSTAARVSAAEASVRSIIWPSRRGTNRAAAAASTVKPTIIANVRRRERKAGGRRPSTAAWSATGQPRSGLREAVYTSSARWRRRAWRRRRALRRSPSRT
ncbi:MAG: hypothetical protein R2734_07385 [Nocardioides sp.]